MLNKEELLTLLSLPPNKCGRFVRKLVKKKIK